MNTVVAASSIAKVIPIDPRRASARTPLTKRPEISRRGATVFVKDESNNPFGTLKDRRCLPLIEKHAEHRDEMVFVQITCGNSGYSLGKLAEEYAERTGKKVTVVNIVQKGKTSKAVLKKLKECSIVHEIELGKKTIRREELCQIARKLTGYTGPDENIVEVEEPGLEKGYRTIVREIKQQMEREDGIIPKYIFVPVGGGELLVEIQEEAERTWGEEVPKIIGVTVSQSVLAHGEEVEFLKKPGKSIADKLVCAFSKFKRRIMELVAEEKVEMVVVKDSEIRRKYSELNEGVISVEPSAAVAFVGVDKYDLQADDVAIVISTGKGIYDKQSIGRVWRARIRKAMVYVAFAMIGAVATIIVTGGWWSSRMEYHGKLRARASYYSELYDKENTVLHERDEKICRLVHKLKRKPGKTRPTNEEIAKRCDRMTLFNLTTGQLEFYNAYMSYGGHGIFPSGLDGIMQRETVKRYQNGEYEDTAKGTIAWIKRNWRHGTIWNQITFTVRDIYRQIRYGPARYELPEN